MRCKKREFQGPFLSIPVLSESFHGTTVSLPPGRVSRCWQSKKKCFHVVSIFSPFPWEICACACTFSPRKGHDSKHLRKSSKDSWYYPSSTRNLCTSTKGLKWFQNFKPPMLASKAPHSPNSFLYVDPSAPTLGPVDALKSPSFRGM